MMRAYNIKRKKAFSLTELLIVIIIIGVLAGIAYVASGQITDKTEATKIVENMRMAKNAMLKYYTKNGKWQTTDNKDINNKKIDELCAEFLDMKLGSIYTVVKTTMTGKTPKEGSIFVRCDLTKVSDGVKSQLAKIAKEADLWNSSYYGDGTYTKASHHYLGPKKTGENSMHLPVDLIYD